MDTVVGSFFDVKTGSALCFTLPLLLLAGCSSTVITPASVRHAATTPDESAALIARWEAAVVIANAFLESPFRRTLPAGRFTVADDGMSFASASGDRWPMIVRYDAIGQACVNLGFVAQERRDGFAIGHAPPRRNVVTDNTFFRTRAGAAQSPESMAALLLHESTHVVLRDGTVTIPKAIAYYSEAVFLLRSRTLTAERRPYATSEEFNRFVQAHGTDEATQATFVQAFETHLARGHTKFCRHGPWPVPPLSPAR